MFPRLVLVIAIIACFGGCGKTAQLSPEFYARSVTVNGERFSYRVFVPVDHDPTKQNPVMLYLHGSGVRGTDNFQQADAFNKSIEPVKSKLRFIVVLPQCRPETFWASTEMSEYALAALDDAVREFNGDRNRLYLSGYSLGGYGTWQIAASRPGKFAALVPVAGGVVGERPIDPKDRAAIIPEVGMLLDSADPYEALAKKLGTTPVWVFHGANDDAVPAEFSRKMVAALRAVGNEHVKYTEYPNEGHSIFPKTIQEPELLEWLGQQKLNRDK
jgi:predicted peptidase